MVMIHESVSMCLWCIEVIGSGRREAGRGRTWGVVVVHDIVVGGWRGGVRQAGEEESVSRLSGSPLTRWPQSASVRRTSSSLSQHGLSLRTTHDHEPGVATGHRAIHRQLSHIQRSLRQKVVIAQAALPCLRQPGVQTFGISPAARCYLSTTAASWSAALLHQCGVGWRPAHLDGQQET